MTKDDGNPTDNLANVYTHLRSQVDTNVTEIAERFLASLDMEVPHAVATSFVAATEGGKRFRALAAISGAATAAAIKHDRPVGGANQRPDPNCRPPDAAEYLTNAANNKATMGLAVALEFYQAAALVHDDIIDKSDTRRGRPTTHVAMTAHHEDAGLVGDPEVFGTDSAILVGDLLLAGADYALSLGLARVESDVACKVLELYARMAGEVAAGQYLDAAITYAPVLPDAGKRDLNETMERTLAVVRSKSARYSLVNPVLLGATIAGTNQASLDVLEDILEPAGIAFQLRDDALGISGTEAKTGKPTGLDVREGKRTVLLALTLENATDEEASVLADVYAATQPTDSQVDRAVRIITETGSGPHEQMIAGLLEQSHQNLEAAPIPEAGRALVHHLTSLLVERSR